MPIDWTWTLVLNEVFLINGLIQVIHDHSGLAWTRAGLSLFWVSSTTYFAFFGRFSKFTILGKMIPLIKQLIQSPKSNFRTKKALKSLFCTEKPEKVFLFLFFTWIKPAGNWMGIHGIYPKFEFSWISWIFCVLYVAWFGPLHV